MGVFDRFERRLERLVEGAFGRVFKGEAAPADIAHALQRETDDRKVVVGAGRVIAPNSFVVTLGDHDHGRLGPYAEPLSEAFAEMLEDHAKQAGYSFAGPIRVDLTHDPALGTGRFQIRSDPATPAPRTRPVAGQPPAPVPAPPTLIQRPAATPPPPVLRHRLVIVADGPADSGRPSPAAESQRILLISPITVLGRSAHADVQLTDPGVSRRHAELHLNGNAVRLIDAGSTNGTTVNGESVTAHELRSGDRIRVGNTILIYSATD